MTKLKLFALISLFSAILILPSCYKSSTPNTSRTSQVPDKSTPTAEKTAARQQLQKLEPLNKALAKKLSDQIGD